MDDKWLSQMMNTALHTVFDLRTWHTVFLELNDIFPGLGAIRVDWADFSPPAATPAPDGDDHSQAAATSDLREPSRWGRLDSRLDGVRISYYMDRSTGLIAPERFARKRATEELGRRLISIFQAHRFSTLTELHQIASRSMWDYTRYGIALLDGNGRICRANRLAHDRFLGEKGREWPLGDTPANQALCRHLIGRALIDYGRLPSVTVLSSPTLNNKPTILQMTPLAGDALGRFCPDADTDARVALFMTDTSG